MKNGQKKKKNFKMKLLNKALLYLPYSIKRRPRINAAAINKITNKHPPSNKHRT